MSFATETKNELARINVDKKCCMLAELAGFIRVCGSVRILGGGKLDIVMSTELPAVVRHYKKLIKSYFGVDTGIKVSEGAALQKGRSYFITIGPEQLSEQILRETGLLMIREGRNFISDGIYSGIIRTKCCRKAYLRGLFIGAGTVSNPEKGYHLEIVCRSETLGNDTKKLFNSFVDINAKVSIRRKEYPVYLKDSGQIMDVLAIIGAHSQYFAFENILLTKEMRNAANRQSNCDQANIDKTLEASMRQISNIKKIAEKKGLKSLSVKLRQVALARLENPEATVAELGEMMNPPLKKSGVYNRLMKIEEIAGKL